MRPYLTVSLRDLLRDFDESEVDSRLRQFVCTRDHDREDFLHNKAIVFEKKGMARTYLQWQTR